MTTPVELPAGAAARLSRANIAARCVLWMRPMLLPPD